MFDRELYPLMIGVRGICKVGRKMRLLVDFRSSEHGSKMRNRFGAKSPWVHRHCEDLHPERVYSNQTCNASATLVDTESGRQHLT